jgi:hypothetical protein
MSVALEAVRDRTGTSIQQARGDALCMAAPIVPMGFALVGGLTGATACAFPSELLDWTSADVIELARPVFLRGDSGAISIIELLAPAESPVERHLDEIKRKSRLTWGQLADAMGVDARAVHLWRRGGGISAGHEERLQEMHAFMNNIDVGTPADVRAELIEAAPGGSLLERLRAGESPRELAAVAPWRSRAREDLDRNLAERESDGILDEDYAFLLYLDVDDAEAFAARASDLLDAPEAARRDWEALIDAQFAAMQQPDPVPVEAADEGERLDDDEGGIAPLFSPADIGIPLGVGAIASRRPLHEGQ